MTDFTSAPQIQVGTFLIAPGTPLPPEWVLSETALQSGWRPLTGSSVLPGVDLVRLQHELVGTGWTFFFMAGEISGTGAGWSRPRMLVAALGELIASARLQKCNCLEIDGMDMRSFLGVPYLRILAHTRNIQKGSTFSGSTGGTAVHA